MATSKKNNDAPETYQRAYFGEGENDFALRSIDEENHTAEFVVASELPVKDCSWEPPTSLRMEGIDLKRYRQNPVVLADHNMQTRNVIGISEKIWVDGGKLIARVKFDVEDEDLAAIVWGKVKRGMLKGASVGFVVTDRKLIENGTTDRKSGLEGPVYLAKRWYPFEWSIVAVGADPTALGRDASQSVECAADDTSPEESLRAAVIATPEDVLRNALL